MMPSAKCNPSEQKNGGMPRDATGCRAMPGDAKNANDNGKYKRKGWRDNIDPMAEKTVYCRLIGKNGLMSIDYQRVTDPASLAAAQAIASGQFDDEDTLPEASSSGLIDADYTVDGETGEIKEQPEA